MAGTGRAPKDKAERRNRGTPTRGEWIEIVAPKKPILPTLQQVERGEWHPRARAMWDAWRKDPATSMWEAGDLALAVETIYLVDEHVQGGPASYAAEIRLRMDQLGLTAKGRQDRRWRVVDETPDVGGLPVGQADEMAARRAAREQALAAGG